MVRVGASQGRLTRQRAERATATLPPIRERVVAVAAVPAKGEQVQRVGETQRVVASQRAPVGVRREKWEPAVAVRVPRHVRRMDRLDLRIPTLLLMAGYPGLDEVDAAARVLRGTDHYSGRAPTIQLTRSFSRMLLLSTLDGLRKQLPAGTLIASMSALR